MIYLSICLALIWLAGTGIRVYQQARFYQIEEYMSLRYLRWLAANPRRWLSWRPLLAWAAGCVAALFAGDTNFATTIILSIAAGVAVWPSDPGEVKKGFKRTSRATRMLGGAFVAAGLTMALLSWLVLRALSGEFGLIVLSTAGFFVWLMGPVWLIVGNLLMTPVEASLRRGFQRQARRKLEHISPKVIGITGSYGKTSTKVYTAGILNGRFHALPTPKSYNTLMGVCLTINTLMEDSVEYFVCEMGAYIRGEIQEISRLTKPRIGIIIEVGPQHLERFGSLENIAIAKYELIKALPEDGVGIFNWDNPYIRDMYARGYPATRIAISQDADAPVDLVASNIQETLSGLSFDVTDKNSDETVTFKTTLLGQHNVTNLLLATAVASHEGMSLTEIAQRVRGLQPAESRLVRNVTPNGLTIINDAYSANPVGVVGSLRVLGMHDTGKRLLVTPGMVELGHLHDEENHKLGQTAAQYATDIILVGEKQTKPVYAGLMDANFPVEQVQIVETLNEAIAWYQQHLTSGDTILFLNDLPDTY